MVDAHNTRRDNGFWVSIMTPLYKTTTSVRYETWQNCTPRGPRYHVEHAETPLSGPLSRKHISIFSAKIKDWVTKFSGGIPEKCGTVDSRSYESTG